ncbi:hypothetical protein LB534_24035 [Mesorhizobium sp. CA18]|nr:hypothetical protein [Mesorhizobium sp. CA9]MBZ9828369.1 hypothetical protein [Mesorhizobium sp. CA18]MBZ9834171.1 hypothetical protein [Mesorhizobium sp. CA2]MBZ9840130.1 hypothetical protein [Mesorhizobium sp. CA3]MBZ9880304.1 hypothetical protein [Mesorhizobium sp. Ca11]MBZ9903262.1 hypothetical protein [Mesorhizobium sp. CA17]
MANTRPTVQPWCSSGCATLATTSTSVDFVSSSGLLTERRWMAAKGMTTSPLVSIRHSTFGPEPLKAVKLSQTAVMSSDGKP